MENDALLNVLPLFYANMNSRKRIRVNQGGSSSGKTYSIMQVLFILAMQTCGQVITVVGQDIPNLKKGSYRDATTIRKNSKILQQWFPKVNEGERIFYCINGSIIEFCSFKDGQDAKNGKRDYLFVNEANGVSWEIYWQLAIRTRVGIFIDYNPSARFWVHEQLIGRHDVELIISDHRQNHYLTEQLHNMIEGIEDDELWKVYARGATGSISGLVFPHYNIVEALPPREEWKMSVYCLDYGFTCFKGDTLIMTADGEKPIKDVKAGDFVLTRKGYKRVKRNIYNGFKKVIHKKFVKGLQLSNIFCTFEHNFNANGKWKKYGELTTKDRLFVLSNSMAWSSKDTQMANTEIISTTSGKKMESTNKSSSISTSMKRSTENCRKVWLCITRISTHSTIALKTLLRLLSQNICVSTPTSLNGKMKTKRSLKSVDIQKKTGKSVEQRCCLNLQQSAECANGAEKNTRQQTRINDFVQSNATINGNTKHLRTISRWFASIAERFSWVTSILNPNAVLRNAHIKWLYPSDILTEGEEWCDVYDLEIEEVHEYFANGILVHNCDPTTLQHLVLAHGEIWTDELIYSTGMTNPMIAERSKALGLTRADTIIADSAEPKSNAELRSMGLNVQGCVKGADSIKNGIDILKRYVWNVTRNSTGIRKELQNYKWKVTKDGVTTNQPVDCFNHGIDAVRYGALEKLKVAARPRGINIRN